MCLKKKSAELIVDFYDKKGIPVPDVYEAQKYLYENEKAVTDHIRRTLWPNKKDPRKAEHPKRWTGNGNLFDDIKTVDELFGSVVKDEIGLPLAEYYRTEYRKMNWQIHSGVSSFWNIPPQAYYLMCGFGFKVCADFGMLCTKIILTDFGFTVAIDDLSQKWKEIQNQRDLASFEGLGISTSS